MIANFSMGMSCFWTERKAASPKTLAASSAAPVPKKYQRSNKKQQEQEEVLQIDEQTLHQHMTGIVQKLLL